MPKKIKVNYIKELLYFDNLQFTERRLSPMGQLVWYKLISLDNQTRWSMRLSISNNHLASLAGISLNTLKRAREELERLQYIVYTPPKTSTSCGVYDMQYSMQYSED